MNGETLQVVCLCAAWCGVCTEYRATFDAAAAGAFGPARFDWLDIEDESELLDDVEVENFPTLLIARGARVLFFGTVTPQAATLARLLSAAVSGELTPTPPSAPVDGLVRRLSRTPLG
jgi:hypothetical protein